MTLPPVSSEPRRRLPAIGTGWVVVLLAIAGTGLLAALPLVADGGSSAASNMPETLPTPEVGTDQACTAFARYWLDETPLDLEAEVIAGLTNCLPRGDGTWFVPIGRPDGRLPEDTRLSPEERTATTPLREMLIEQIDDLEQRLPASLKRELERAYDPHPQAVSGHIREGVQIGRTRSRYTRTTQAFLIPPQRAALADYVAWHMADRIAAYEALEAACLGNPTAAYLTNACRGLEDSLSIRYPPWPWVLRDTIMLDRYLGERLRSGSLPSDDAATGWRSGARTW